MTFVDRVTPGAVRIAVSLETLRTEARVAQHRPSGEQVRAGIRPELLQKLNQAETNLFLAAIASLVPGIDADIDGARDQLDGVYYQAYGSPRDELKQRIANSDHSSSFLARIDQVLAKYGLRVTGPQR